MEVANENPNNEIDKIPVKCNQGDNPVSSLTRNREESKSFVSVNSANSANSAKSNHTSHSVNSVYTQNLKPFIVKLILNKKTSLSKILKRSVIKDDKIFILKVNYHSCDSIFDWVIYKTYKHIREVFDYILFHMKEIHLNNDTDNDNYLSELKQTIEKIEELLKTSKDNNSCEISSALKILNNLPPSVRDRVFFLEFLEISRHSFDCFNDNNKPKEGYILKQTNASSPSALSALFCCCLLLCKSYTRRWFVLKEEMICYLEDSSSNIGKNVFWFDQEIVVERASQNKINLVNGSRILTLKFGEEFEREIWYESIDKRVKTYQNNVKNGFSSFANEKTKNQTRFFIDACDYFADLWEKLNTAEETIYIAGWWVSPELFLKRPVHVDNEDSRLMDVLRLKAEQGVKIHLLIYKEVRIALTVDSSHTKDVFNGLHPNIKVTRHPKNRLDLLWSHHEKIVVVDEKVAYLGGIDLCWGRYDTKEHKLGENANEEGVYEWPGIEYSNSRVKDIANVALYKLESVDRNKHPRMPWHDITVSVQGPAVNDLTRHFVERWNFARTSYQRDKKHTIISCIIAIY